MGDVATRDGLWQWDDVLEEAEGLAGGRSVEAAAQAAARQAGRSRQDRLVEGERGQRIGPGKKGGEAVGPNPTDRGKTGSKRHLLTERDGVPMVVLQSPANTHDSRLFEPLIDAVPPIKRPRGRPRKRPEKLHSDKGYDYPRCRAALTERGIKVRIARRGVDSSQRLGRHRWVVERTLAWLSQYRRLTVRYERRADIHQAFLHLGCALICLHFLNNK